MNQPVTPKYITASAYVVAAILVLIPFHALLSVWVGSSFGVYDAARVWKEGLLLALTIPAGYLLWRDRALAKKLWSQPLVWLIVAYLALHLAAAGWALATDQVSSKAALYAGIVNLRFVLFFLLCAVIAARSPWLRAHWQKLVFIPASVVVGFGLLQAFVLPKDVLMHAGYGPATIAPYGTVDQKEEYARVQSTLRGPNPLGAYLVVVIGAALAVLLAERSASSAKATEARAGRKRWLLGALLTGSAMVLFFSYSRSAYIGAIVAAALVCWMLVRDARLRRWMLVAAGAVVLVGGGATVLLRDNDRVQNVLFHTNEHSASSDSSNEDRTGGLQAGLRDVVHEPLGRGPGTAGPASAYNNGQVRIAENYYLQIGQEVGWIGLGLFVAILIAVGWALVRLAPDPLAVALLASLVGLGVVNLFVHAWADDTLGLLWWSLAGVAILSNKK